MGSGTSRPRTWHGFLALLVKLFGGGGRTARSRRGASTATSKSYSRARNWNRSASMRTVSNLSKRGVLMISCAFSAQKEEVDDDYAEEKRGRAPERGARLHDDSRTRQRGGVRSFRND